MNAALPVYPIEVGFPDLGPWQRGNTGIDWVHGFDSGRAGPHVMINALTHGNEVCGAITVAQLLAHGLRPRRGRLTLAFANVAAYHSFDAAKPDASRFLDQDFNRLWRSELLGDLARRSSELARARELRPVIDGVDLLLDLHSMHESSQPLLLSGPLEKGVRYAREIGSPPTVICDAGHPEGRRLRDYGAFGDAASPRNALLVECGQHWTADAVRVAQDCTARVLRHAGIVEVADLPPGWLRPVAGVPEVIRVTDAVVAKSMDFRFAGPYTGLEEFAAAGTVIGWQGSEPVLTPYPNCVLVMPSLRQLRPGVTVVRFGRREPRSGG
ncbi:MAG: M14 family metallopeptidase [Steroidobacteraceae bacterium]